MIIDGVTYYPVTEDPDKLAQLREKDDQGAGSRRLGAFAYSLGLTPPDHAEGQPIPAVVTVYPGDDYTTGVYVWNIHQMEEPADEPETFTDDANPWNSAF